MKQLNVLVATLALTCLALFPATVRADDDVRDALDDLDVTMVVLDDDSDPEDVIAEMRGPEGEHSDDDTGDDGDHDGDGSDDDIDDDGHVDDDFEEGHSGDDLDGDGDSDDGFTGGDGFEDDEEFGEDGDFEDDEHVEDDVVEDGEDSTGSGESGDESGDGID